MSSFLVAHVTKVSEGYQDITVAFYECRDFRQYHNKESVFVKNGLSWKNQSRDNLL